jgi:hypothetical protein
MHRSNERPRVFRIKLALSGRSDRSIQTGTHAYTIKPAYLICDFAKHQASSRKEMAETAKTQFVTADNGVKFAYRRIGEAKGVPIVHHIHFRGSMDFW